MASPPDKPTVDSIAQTLLPNTNLAHPPKKAQDEELTATIADLHLHPTLEALLHILNYDLTSAHFLVRHMQAPPAVEGMLLHGILHRAEGDFNNARAWVSDVEDACEGFQPKKREEETRLEDEVFEKVQSGNAIRDSLISYVYKSESPTQLIDDVEAFRSKKASERTNGEEEDIEDRIRKEAGKVLEWCTSKFGAGAWTDATKAWVKNSEEISKMSGDMISGGKGYREF